MASESELCRLFERIDTNSQAVHTNSQAGGCEVDEVQASHVRGVNEVQAALKTWQADGKAAEERLLAKV